MRWALLLVPLLFGCIRAVGAVAKPTALEYQLLGAYEQLDEELANSASIRAPGLTTSFEKLQSEALEARSIQKFNEDDLLQLKDETCIAEALGARVVPRPCAFLERDPAAGRRRARVITEENRSRSVILTWAAYELARRSGRASPTEADLADIRGAYTRLLLDTAAPRHLIETDRGVFKPASALGGGTAR